MTEALARNILEELKQRDFKIESGLSNREVMTIQDTFDIVFPPDLMLLHQQGLIVNDMFPNWRKALNSGDTYQKIRESLDWPLKGMLFDVEHNSFWQNQWGSKTESLKANLDIARKYFKNYPKLIPIFAHRYIPSSPKEMDNPVFSVMQMDIIYVGMNLPDYFSCEFGLELNPALFENVKKRKREIPFWSLWP